MSRADAAGLRVGITTGDPAGIGPEIALKTAADPRVRAVARPCVFGDPLALQAHLARTGLPLRLRVHARASAIKEVGAIDEVDVVHVPGLSAPPELGVVAGAHGAAAIAALDAATGAALDGRLDAVVAGPIHEVAIREAGIFFDGHPGWLARRTGTPVEDVYLMLCWGAIRIAHLTLHVSVREALAQVTQDRVGRVIATTGAALRRLGIDKPRIGVAGLNPHAGEAGLFGREEIEVIEPAVRAAQAQGLDVIGPIGADTLLPRRDCDAFVVMLHDQGHVLAKFDAPAGAAALSIGTPVLFSSVAHGTAMDLAGQGRASPEAMVQAVLQVCNAAARNPMHAGAAG